MDFYFDSYGDLTLQRAMVSDQVRTDAFADAIAEVVKDGDRVLDVGTGTGLLAMLSAKAGAEKVFGIDQASVAELATKLVEHNGLSDKVEIIKGNAKNLQLPEKVDVLVSEWLGHFGFVETMLDDVIVARDKNLKPNGTMLPCGIELFMAPISVPWIYGESGPGFWDFPVHGIDYSPLEEMELKQAIAGKSVVPVDALLSRGESLMAFDLKTVQRDDPWRSGDLEFVIEEDGRMDGFVGWFTSDLSPEITLDTGPGSIPTHWGQTHLMFPPRDVKKGDALKAHFALNRHPFEERSLELKLTVDEETIHYTVG
ncbi:MAG: 50S ribosomal protein L11 methyltransferase [Opitutaceae bacterium]|nr:50S ribosomal protein L11 methyltransferase [Opitutaceae bacterium]